MKTQVKYTVIFILFVFYTIQIRSYSQSVFPKSDAIWNIQINNQEYYYGLSGDTIINDTVYNKLYLLNDTTLYINHNDEYIGGLRQEAKMVWFRPVCLSHDDGEKSNDEVLLYDFSKNKGDTIWNNGEIYGNSSCIHKTPWPTISRIDSIFKNGNNGYVSSQYKYVKNENPLPLMNGHDTVLEGIGSLKGLFWFLYEPSMSGGSSYKLVCFKQGGQIKYKDTNCTSCFNWLSTNTPTNNIKQPIDVFLERNFLRIKGESSIFPCNITLFNFIGQLLFIKTINTVEESIFVSEELRGIYLYHLKRGNDILKSGKLIYK